MQIGTIYVMTQGAQLTKVGERLIIRAPDKSIIQDIPFFRVRQIVCFGTVEITANTIFQIMYRDIDVVYLTKGGRFKCRLSNLNGKSVLSRIAQYKKADDAVFRLHTAGAIVRGKLEEYKKWMAFRHRRGNADCSREIASISEAISMISAAKNTDELMGLEGIGSKAYFEAFRKNVKQDLGFYERNRRPPKDPVNAMLSFGYTILLHKVLSAIEIAGVDPFLANLHANQNARPSLALDLMEEFRHYLVDCTVLRLVNLAQVRSQNFIFTADKGVLMQESTIALLIKELQARLSANIVYSRDGKKAQLQDIIQKQAYHYRAVVLGDESRYMPVSFNWR